MGGRVRWGGSGGGGAVVHCREPRELHAAGTGDGAEACAQGREESEDSILPTMVPILGPAGSVRFPPRVSCVGQGVGIPITG